MKNNLKKFTCINCGHKVNELYKKYSSSVLKLITCEKCQNVADKYIEYDPIIIMIDLVLLRKEAYRHILFNSEFKSHWKLAIILQIMEAYSEWMITTPSSKIEVDSKKMIIDLEDFNTGNLEFYKICLKVMSRTTVFIFIMMLLTIISNTFQFKQSINWTLLYTVWKAITLSSFGIFLLLPSLIWDDNVQEFHLTFVTLYTLISQILAYTVATECPKMWSIIVIILSYYFKAFSCEIYSYIYNCYE